MLRHPFSFPNISGSRQMTVNQTIRQTRKVIAYFRQSVVQNWGQAQYQLLSCELYTEYSNLDAVKPAN